MKLMWLAWKNVSAKPLRLVFNLILIALASGLITITVLINSQFGQYFEKNLAGIDLILSAKGSPLQSVLCNMFHVDVPTGNIPVQEAKAFLNPAHPVIKKAVPLALGDQVQGFRMLGTTLEMFELYQAQLSEGNYFNSDFQAVVGSEVAEKLKLTIGSVLFSGHGFIHDEAHMHQHEDHQFKVIGILTQTGSISDRLIFVSVSSYWALHHDHQHDEEDIQDHHHHHPVCIRNTDLLQTEEFITSILLTFKGTNIQSLSFGRAINENTGLMAVYPAIELNRLYEITGSATELISFIAYLILVLAMFSLFINMWQAMEERKYEMALLRLAGASNTKVFFLVLMESFILTGMGILIGMISAHLILEFFGEGFQLQSKYGIHGLNLIKEEIWILIAGLLIGLISGIIPAMKVVRRNIHNILSDN